MLEKKRLHVTSPGSGHDHRGQTFRLMSSSAIACEIAIPSIGAVPRPNCREKKGILVKLYQLRLVQESSYLVHQDEAFVGSKT